MKKIIFILGLFMFFLSGLSSNGWCLTNSSCNLYVADNGSDMENSCDNISTPCLTISYALQFVNSDNKTICLIPDNDLLTSFKGNVTISKPVIIKSIDDNSVPIILTDNSSQDGAAFIIESDNVTIENIDIEEDKGEYGIKFIGNVDNITIRNCYFGNFYLNDNRSVIFSQDNISNILLDNLTIYGQNGYLINFIGNGNNIKIVSNDIHHKIYKIYGYDSDNNTVPAINLKNITNLIFDYNTLEGNIVFDNVTDIIIGNSGFFGCGNYLYDEYKTCLNFVKGNIDNVTIDSNTLDGSNGGRYGIVFFDNASNIVINNNFISNFGYDGKGILFFTNTYHNDITIKENTIINNSCNNIFIDGYNSFISIENNNFKNSLDNYSINSLDCGNVFIYNTKYALINGNQFDNTSDNSSTFHLYLGGKSEFVTISNNGFYQTGGANGRSIVLDNDTSNIIILMNKIITGFQDCTQDNRSNSFDIYSQNNVIFFNDFYNTCTSFDNISLENLINNDWYSPVKISYEYYPQENLFTSYFFSHVKDYFGNFFYPFEGEDLNNDGLIDNDGLYSLINNTSNYTIDVWWLTGNFIDSNYEMRLSDTGSKVNALQINSNDEMIWIDNTSKNMMFEKGDENDNTSWTGQIFLFSPVDGSITIEIGKYYDNDTFEKISEKTINISSNQQRYIFYMYADNFTTDNSYLAFKVKNNSSNSIKILVGGGFSFISSPVDKYSLKVNVNGGIHGTIKSYPEGICISSSDNCTAQVDNSSFFHNTKIVLSGYSDKGYKLTWENCDNVSGDNCTVSVTPDRVVTANFTTYVPINLIIDNISEEGLRLCGYDNNTNELPVYISAYYDNGSYAGYLGGDLNSNNSLKCEYDNFSHSLFCDSFLAPPSINEKYILKFEFTRGECPVFSGFYFPDNETLNDYNQYLYNNKSFLINGDNIYVHLKSKEDKYGNLNGKIIIRNISSTMKSECLNNLYLSVNNVFNYNYNRSKNLDNCSYNSDNLTLVCPYEIDNIVSGLYDIYLKSDNQNCKITKGQFSLANNIFNSSHNWSYNLKLKLNPGDNKSLDIQALSIEGKIYKISGKITIDNLSVNEVDNYFSQYGDNLYPRFHIYAGSESHTQYDAVIKNCIRDNDSINRYNCEYEIEVPYGKYFLQFNNYYINKYGRIINGNIIGDLCKSSDTFLIEDNKTIDLYLNIPLEINKIQYNYSNYSSQISTNVIAQINVKLHADNLSFEDLQRCNYPRMDLYSKNLDNNSNYPIINTKYCYYDDYNKSIDCEFIIELFGEGNYEIGFSNNLLCPLNNIPHDNVTIVKDDNKTISFTYSKTSTLNNNGSITGNLIIENVNERILEQCGYYEHAGLDIIFYLNREKKFYYNYLIGGNIKCNYDNISKVICSYYKDNLSFDNYTYKFKITPKCSINLNGASGSVSLNESNPHVNIDNITISASQFSGTLKGEIKINNIGNDLLKNSGYCDYWTKGFTTYFWWNIKIYKDDNYISSFDYYELPCSYDNLSQTLTCEYEFDYLEPGNYKIGISSSDNLEFLDSGYVQNGVLIPDSSINDATEYNVVNDNITVVNILYSYSSSTTNNEVETYTPTTTQNQTEETTSPTVEETTTTINEVQQQIEEQGVTEETTQQVNEAIEQTAQSAESVETPEDAVTTVNNISKITDISSTVVESGGEIDVDKLAETVSKVKNVTDVVAKTENTEALKEIAENTVKISENLTKVIENTKKVEAVTKLTNVAKDIAEAGLKSAALGKATPQKAVEVLDSSLKVVEKSVEIGEKIAKKPKEIVTLVKNSGATAGEVVNTIEKLKDVVNKDTKEVLVEKVQEKAAVITDQIDKVIEKVKPEEIKPDNAKEVKQGISKLASSVVKVSDTGIKPDVVETVQKVTKNLLKKVEDDIPVTPQTLPKIVKVAAVDLTEGLIAKPEIKDNKLVNSLPEVVNPEKPILNEANKIIKPKDLMDAVLNKLTNNKIIEVDKQTLLNKVTINNIEFPTYISDVSIFAPDIKEDIFIATDGSVMLNDNGLLQKVSPAPLDGLSVVNTLLKDLTSNEFSANDNISDNKSLVKINRDGSIVLNLGNIKIVGAFSYNVKKENRLSVGTVSFSMPVSNPTLAAYSVLVHYEDGSSQPIYPYIHDFDKLSELLDPIPELIYNFDRNTGILTIEIGDAEYKYKPDFNVEALTTEELEWFNQNKDDLGIAFKFGDYNNDGIGDVKYYTEEGSQILYGVH